MRRHDHAHFANPQAGARPQLHANAGVEGAGCDELPIGQPLHHEIRLERRIAWNPRMTAQRDAHRRPLPGLVSQQGRRGIHHQSQCAARHVVTHECAQNGRGVGVSACAGIILRVGNDDRFIGAGSQLRRMHHRFFR
ncbi:hypothetical protein G6F59_017756 [Rhizopus arrhizus]|nr:hypothetical protein G6F59_017756 [Rhizopus arrhizus]